MAAKKFYAVKKGKKTGIFASWEECKNLVSGYAGAQYKGFSTRKEAEAYLSGEEDAGRLKKTELSESDSDSKKEASLKDLPAPDTLLAYVDGSYDNSLPRYAFGCVFILPDGRIYTEYGNGDNQDSLKLRNVTGEMLGAMFAVKFAMKNGFKKLEIRYDYQGIEKWVTGEWKSKTELTRKYAEAMRSWSRAVAIHFTKVAAHTNVEFNELADKLAKTGLVKGNGVPMIRLTEEMEQYDGTDSFK